MKPVDMWLPVPMLKNKLVRAILSAGSIGAFCKAKWGTYTKKNREATIRAFVKVRCKHDFPFFAFAYQKIKNKEGGKNVRFRLKYPQRILLGKLEEMRLSGVPIRIILLKARQWGGSTLVQLYIAWIQLFWKEGWYSSIIAQDGSTSRKIKAMYSKMLEELPAWLIGLPDDAKLQFSPYEGSINDSIITYGKGVRARDTVITVGTYNSPASGRGGDISCAHYSEVGFWEDTPGKTPEEIIRSISSSLLIAPLTVEVMESTANGMGNYFYKAYDEAKKGLSSRKPVFIPWFKIELYEIPVADKASFAQWLLDCKGNPNPPAGCKDAGEYYWHLWELGASFEAINWYITKRKEYIDHSDMMAEYPSDDIEAFQNTGRSVFSMSHIDMLRKTCKPPIATGEVQGRTVSGKDCLTNLKFISDTYGRLKIWAQPRKGNPVKDEYLVIVDVGGRSSKADYSNILVINRYWMMYGGKPEVVAEWHGHIDHDLLAWKAAQIAAYYNNAQLIIESNTIETKDNDTDGDQSELIFNKLSGVYKNLYVRKASEAKIAKGVLTEYGFHTNRRTKPVIISNLVSVLRDCEYIERNIEALDEYGTYEKKDGGGWGATEGNHDDRLMTRAIGLYVCFCEMDLPKEIKQSDNRRVSNRPVSEASII
ncbi:MAG: terminase [Prevotellaceae bacterium]|nr:terminase [Prevotellaceae bacterium]